MSFKSCILLLGLVAYLSNQVSSLKCYECTSFSDGKCYKDPQQPEFERTCSFPLGIESTDVTDSVLASTLNSLLSKYTHIADSENKEIKADCATLQVTIEGHKQVARSCFPSMVTCEHLETALGGVGAVVDLCSRCETDLCNSKKLV